MSKSNLVMFHPPINFFLNQWRLLEVAYSHYCEQFTEEGPALKQFKTSCQVKTTFNLGDCVSPFGPKFILVLFFRQRSYSPWSCSFCFIFASIIHFAIACCRFIFSCFFLFLIIFHCNYLGAVFHPTIKTNRCWFLPNHQPLTLMLQFLFHLCLHHPFRHGLLQIYLLLFLLVLHELLSSAQGHRQTFCYLRFRQLYITLQNKSGFCLKKKSKTIFFQTMSEKNRQIYLSPIMRNPVFGDLWACKIQTGLFTS